MAKVERVRQVLSYPFGAEELKNQTEQGWKIVAIEWEREIAEVAPKHPQPVKNHRLASRSQRIPISLR